VSKFIIYKTNIYTPNLHTLALSRRKLLLVLLCL